MDIFELGLVGILLALLFGGKAKVDKANKKKVAAKTPPPTTAKKKVASDTDSVSEAANKKSTA